MKNNNFEDVTLIAVLYKSDVIVNSFLENFFFFKNILLIDNSNNIILKKQIKKKFKNIKYFLSKKNLGYAGGNNFLLKKVRTPYVFIVSPDVRFDKLNFEILYNASKLVSTFGILCPNNISEKNYIRKIKIKNKLLNINKNILEVERPHGCALLINMHSFRKVNFFDSNFFLYYEDIDLFKRFLKKQYKIYVIKNSLMMHASGKSSAISNILDIRYFHWGWSFFYYHKKYYGILLSSIFSLILTIKVILVFLIIRENKLSIIKGIIDSVFINRLKDFYRKKY
jgi:GT2 family glycosyltransferase